LFQEYVLIGHVRTLNIYILTGSRFGSPPAEPGAYVCSYIERVAE
jgi:hypothetical protein